MTRSCAGSQIWAQHWSHSGNPNHIRWTVCRRSKVCLAVGYQCSSEAFPGKPRRSCGLPPGPTTLPRNCNGLRPTWSSRTLFCWVPSRGLRRCVFPASRFSMRSAFGHPQACPVRDRLATWPVATRKGARCTGPLCHRVYLYRRNGLPPLNAARAGLGLAPLRSAFEQYDKVSRVLMLMSSSLEFPHRRPPANERFVGTPIGDSGVSTWQAPWPLEGPPDAPPERISAAIQCVLNDRRFRSAAQQLGAAIEQEGDAVDNAIRAIEDVLRPVRAG